jgi:hypothetical protein
LITYIAADAETFECPTPTHQSNTEVPLTPLLGIAETNKSAHPAEENKWGRSSVKRPLAISISDSSSDDDDDETMFPGTKALLLETKRKGARINRYVVSEADYIYTFVQRMDLPPRF